MHARSSVRSKPERNTLVRGSRRAAVADERAEADEDRPAIGAATGGVGPAAEAGGGEAGLHAGVQVDEHGPTNAVSRVTGEIGSDRPVHGVTHAEGSSPSGRETLPPRPLPFFRRPEAMSWSLIRS